MTFQALTTGLYFSLVAVLVAPIWANEYVLTQDGPMHLHNARIMLDQWLGRAPDFYREYYVSNLVPFPYWIGHLSGAVLLSVCTPATAEKLFLTTCIVLYAVALRSLVRAVDISAAPLAFAGLPLVWNRTFQMGFFEFSFSVGVLLALLAFTVRCIDAWSWGRGVVLSLLFLLLYFCHPTTYLIAAGCVLSLALCSEPRQFPVVLTALAPSALLMGRFLAGAPNYAIAPPTPVPTLLLNFVSQSNLTAWTAAEAPLAIAVAVLFLLLSMLALRERVATRRLDRYDAFVIAAIATLVMHLYGSARLVGFFERLQFMPLLLLLPWLASRRWSFATQVGLMVCVAVIVVAFVVIRYPRQRLASERVSEYVSVQSSIDPRSTVLVVNYDYDGGGDGVADSDLLPIYLHAAEYLGASDRSLILFNNIGGLYPMFPYLWGADRNPFVHLQTADGIEGDPPSADLFAYRARTGGTVDYVVTIGFDISAHKAHPATLRLVEQLARGYAPIFTSASKRAVVYRAHPQPPVAELAAAHLDHSFELYQARRFAESIDAARQALALDPGSDRAHNNICAAYNSTQDWERAVAACDEALRLNPDNQLAKNNRAWAHNGRAGSQ